MQVKTYCRYQYNKKHLLSHKSHLKKDLEFEVDQPTSQSIDNLWDSLDGRDPVVP
eukprot:TRINITY_DN2939_c0_g1_i1.p3 TRINITY_DN2939_c0_g1~~TRINITY_DN2939_c0_g1_i1.p3  ORF type:complete len:55 (-),score=5.31 TRINITY_DN2939_c0_g1_i1:56-220(-)